MPDPLDRFTALRPPTVADNDWADSPEGRTALERIRRRLDTEDGHVGSAARSGRRWWKPLLAVPAAVAAAGGLTAAFVIAGHRPHDPGQVLCLRTASTTAEGAGLTLKDPTPAAALDACSAQWAQLFPGDPTPAGFAVCVYRQDPVRNSSVGGGQVVLPAPAPVANSAAACTAAGFDPVTP